MGVYRDVYVDVHVHVDVHARVDVYVHVCERVTFVIEGHEELRAAEQRRHEATLSSGIGVLARKA